jgi:hypothetical protein
MGMVAKLFSNDPQQSARIRNDMQRNETKKRLLTGGRIPANWTSGKIKPEQSQ